MILLEVFECFIVVLYLALIITQIFVPMAQGSVLFPLFRKKDASNTKKETNKKGE